MCCKGFNNITEMLLNWQVAFLQSAQGITKTWLSIGNRVSRKHGFEGSNPLLSAKQNKGFLSFESPCFFAFKISFFSPLADDSPTKFQLYFKSDKYLFDKAFLSFSTNPPSGAAVSTIMTTNTHASMRLMIVFACSVCAIFYHSFPLRHKEQME